MSEVLEVDTTNSLAAIDGVEEALDRAGPAQLVTLVTGDGFDAEGIDVRSADDLMRIALAHRVETLDELRTLSSAE